MTTYSLPKYASIKVLLLTIFVGYYANIALFTHIHVDGNEIVAHAHPFAKSDKSGGTSSALPHEHNKVSLQLIAKFSHFVSTGEATIATTQIFIPAYPVTHHYISDNDTVTDCPFSTQLRAPPQTTA